MATLQGTQYPVGSFKIVSLAGKYDYTKATKLVCPKCSVDTEYLNPYHCPQCGENFSSWMKLKRVDKITGEELPKPRLLPEKTTAQAQVYHMSAEEFAQKYLDITADDKGIEPLDANSVLQLQLLLVLAERMQQVIVLRWNDTYQINVAVLTLSPSNRVVLKEIIPRPLVIPKPTFTVDPESVSEQHLSLAKILMDNIPEVTDEVMTVDDFRTHGVQTDYTEAEAEMKAEVKSLMQVLAQMQVLA